MSHHVYQEDGSSQQHTMGGMRMASDLYVVLEVDPKGKPFRIASGLLESAADAEMTMDVLRDRFKRDGTSAVVAEVVPIALKKDHM
jgi:hypothetical protein